MPRIPLPLHAIFLAAGLAVCAAGQTPSTGSLEGQVVDRITGAPLAAASVDVLLNIGKTNRPGQQQQPNRPMTAQTDPQGKFAFRNLAPGIYSINAQKPGFLSGPNGNAPVQIVVGEQQALQGVLFKMIPQATLTGKITGSSGEALAAAVVTVLRQQFVQGKAQWTPIYSGPTNAQGEYRITGVAPGRYRLNASIVTSQPATDHAVSRYVATPSSDAVQVTGGAEVRTDIKMQMAPTVRIRGQVVDADNKPVAVVPGLIPQEGGTNSLNGAALPDGGFEFNGVPAGGYFLTARGNGGAPLLAAAKSITVADKNLDGVVVQLRAPRDVAGTVQAEGGAAIDPRTMTIVANSLDGYGSSVAVKGDGPADFVLHNVPAGRSTLTVYAPFNAYLKSVQYGGKPLDSAGGDLTGGETVSVVVSTAGGTLSGHVTDAAAKPARAMLALVPAGGQAAELEQSASDYNGEFRFRMLRPGDYKLFAWAPEDAANLQDPEVYRQFESKARSVKLEAGRATSAAVAIIGDTVANPLELPKTKATVEGTVLNGKTGAPVRNGVVRLVQTGFGVNIMARSPYTSSAPGLMGQTDEQGHFVVRNVEAGAYQVSAEASGYLTAIYGVGADGSADPLIVGQGQALKGIAFSLTPQFVITVKVTDEGGDPVDQAAVTLYGREPRSNRPGLSAIKEGVTNAQGEFRFESLAAGTYFASAHPEPPMPPVEAALLPVPDFPEMRYITTYAPDSLDIADAKPIVLEGGATTVRVDIKVRKTATFEIRGMVTGVPKPGTPGGIPLGSIPQPPIVRLYPKDDPNPQLPGAGAIVARPNASFAILDVPPGSYILVARAYAVDASHLFGASVPVEIKDRHFDNLEVPLKPAMEVKARVVWDKPSSARLGGMYVMMASVYPTGSQSPGQWSEQDSTFTFRSVLQQPYRLDVMNLPPNCNCSVKAIRYGGREVPPSGMDFTTGEQLEIVLGAGQ